MKIYPIIVLVVCSLSLSLFSRGNEAIKVTTLDKAGKPLDGDALFIRLLEKSEKLKAQFTLFESKSKENAGGRYGGYSVNVIELQSSISREKENLELGIYSETEIKDLALHIRFYEGMHMGGELTKGFFVLLRSVSTERTKRTGLGDETQRLSITGEVLIGKLTEKIDLAELKPMYE